MNNSDTIEVRRKVGSDCFNFIKSSSADMYLKDFVNLFNFDDYWCYKKTREQRLVTKEEFLEFKYSGYTFFKKDLYGVNRIEQWIEWMKNMGGIQYLSKPLPPFNPNKVIIKN